MGKELIFQALRHEETKELPWVPFAGVHVGKLKGYTAEEVLRDEDKLVECLIEANKLYTPDGLPVIFDLQVEAEILGCDLMWAENNPPSVKSHPLAAEKTIPCKCKIPTENDGRLPMILSAMKRATNICLAAILFLLRLQRRAVPPERCIYRKVHGF